MARPEHYHQPALSLDQTPRSHVSAEQQQPPIPDETFHHGEAPIMPSIAADPEGLPHGLANHRIPDDFWPEFHLEWAFREQHGMTPVLPQEFADMRDFSDGMTVFLDIDAHPRPYERTKTE